MKQQTMTKSVTNASCTFQNESPLIQLKTMGNSWRETLIRPIGLIRHNLHHRHQTNPSLAAQVSVSKKKKLIRRSPLKGGAALEYIIVTIFSATAAVTVMDLVKKMMQAQAEKLEHSLEDDQL